MKHILTWIIAGLGALAIVAAAYYMQRPAQPLVVDEIAQPPGSGVVGVAERDADPFDVVITYTDDGYSPRDITIAAGTRVRFLNSSSKETWPASGVHPTHSLYPEKESTDCLGSSFDACRALKPGEFFDYTFYYTGTWTFHDHIHAFHSGSIAVTASSSQQ